MKHYENLNSIENHLEFLESIKYEKNKEPVYVHGDVENLLIGLLYIKDARDEKDREYCISEFLKELDTVAHWKIARCIWPDWEQDKNGNLIL